MASDAIGTICIEQLFHRIIMLTDISPKLPMRDKAVTRDYYLNQLGLQECGSAGFDGYLMVQKDTIHIHFFAFRGLDPKQNYGQVYIRTNDIKKLYHSFLYNGVNIYPNGDLRIKPWGQKEFSLLDPNNNLPTFGQEV